MTRTLGAVSHRTERIVLETLRRKSPLHLRAISRKTGLSTDTVLRVVHSLTKRGILSVERQGTKRLYRLASKPSAKKLTAPNRKETAFLKLLEKNKIQPTLLTEQEMKNYMRSYIKYRRGFERLIKSGCPVLEALKWAKTADHSATHYEKVETEETESEDVGPQSGFLSED